MKAQFLIAIAANDDAKEPAARAGAVAWAGARAPAAQSQATARYATTAEAVARLTMPALVLHGDEDRAVLYEAGQALAKALLNSRFETLRAPGTTTGTKQAHE